MTERYDINKSFEDNKKEGPYDFENIQDQNNKIQELLKDNCINRELFGFKTNFPLGVAAGPLFNERYMKAAAMDGFSIITWKTFRSESRLAHKNDGTYYGHNMVVIDLEKPLQLQDLQNNHKANLILPNNRTNLSITNSFGMGSDSPEIWQEEIKNLEPWMKENNKLTIASVVGSPKSGWTIEDLADDYAKTSKLAESSGSKIIELNFSCPNVKEKEGSIYKNPKDSKIICKKVRQQLNPDTKLLIKIGYGNKQEYTSLIDATKDYIDGISAINTLALKVVDSDGKQALPGGLTAGICGYGLIDLAVDAVKFLSEIRKENNYNFKILGVGGVTTPENAMRHINAGADFVMVGASALFNPQLPLEFAKYLKDNQINM